MAAFEMKWQAPEYEHREKGASWYWISIILSAAIIAFAVWEKNFLFGLFILIAELLLIVTGNRMPRTVNFAINQDGIEIEGGKGHLWKEFESMSIDPQSDDWVEIFFTFKAKFKTPLKVFLPAARQAEFRADLKSILRETAHEPSLIDSIEKLLRF